MKNKNIFYKDKIFEDYKHKDLTSIHAHQELAKPFTEQNQKHSNALKKIKKIKIKNNKNP